VDPRSPDRSPPDDRDDRDLLAAHVAGDPQAFGVLFRRHRDRLWAVALRTTGDPEEAADALQDALVNAFRRAGGYRSESAVTTWLHRIVVNACLDRLRRRTVRAAEPLPETGAFDRTVTVREPPPGPERAAELTERRDRVLAALQQVSPEQRAALVLVDMEGRPVEEAARILGVPVGTVKSRCARGRARLAPLLGDLRDAPDHGSADRSRAGSGDEPGASVPDPAGNRSVGGHVLPDEGRSVP
jgi:RNA polymerase sigma-70 factor (ECF subfamily)